jgi:hypothetical protein
VKTQTYLPLLLANSFVITLMGCGAAGAGGSPTASGGGTGSQTPFYSMTVATDAELPSCASANDKQLVYVKTSGAFKSCDAGQWVTIDIKGKDGMTVVSNQLLSPYTTNLCTRYSSIESCFFTGGQIVKYSDGSVLLTGSYAYELFFDDDNGGGDFDRMTSSITMLVPPTVQYFWQKLDWSVARQDDDGRPLYMIYDRSNDRVVLVYDANDNAQPDLTDEILHTVVKTAISN